jgi:hypothetical protein
MSSKWMAVRSPEVSRRDRTLTSDRIAADFVRVADGRLAEHWMFRRIKRAQRIAKRPADVRDHVSDMTNVLAPTSCILRRSALSAAVPTNAGHWIDRAEYAPM